MASFGFGPTLALRARRVVAGAFDLSGGVLPAGASLTRNSTGYRQNPAGLLVSEANDVARFDYRAGECKGLLVEPTRTNLLLQSDSIGTSPWTFTNASWNVDVIAAPDGNMTADKLTELTVSNQHRVMQSITLAVGQSACVSGYVRQGERNRALLRLIGAATFLSIAFDLATGTKVSGTGTVEDFGGGWTYVAGVPSALVDQAAVSLQLNLQDANGTSSYAGAANSGIYAWGLQVEIGSKPTSRIPTTSGAATRQADVLTLNWASKGVPDGDRTIRYTFDDGSIQEIVATIAGGEMIVPATSLARTRVRRIEA